MENHAQNVLNDDVQSAIGGLIGKACCRQRLGRMRSLSLGFGEKIPHGDARLPDSYYGEWEIGTYTAAWRVVRGQEVICGSQDVVDSLQELENNFRQIEIGRVKTMSLVSRFDIRIIFDNDVYIDFLGTTCDDDEIFHIFGPNGKCLNYSIRDGWEITPCGRP